MAAFEAEKFYSGLISAELDRWPTSNLSHAVCRIDVDTPLRVDHHPIVAPRFLGGDQAVEHIIQHALRIALLRVAEPAAARQAELDRIARRHGLAALRPDRPAGAQRDRAVRPGLAAGAAARGGLHALEGAQERDRRGTGAAELDHLAEPAAEFARPARAFAKLAAAKHDRRHALGRLDRDRAHAGRKCRGAEPILAGA